MRPGVVMVLAGFFAAAIAPATAAPYSLLDKPRVDFWRNSYVPHQEPKQLNSREIRYTSPYSDVLASRLGLVDGKAAIFRYDLNKNGNGSSTIEGDLEGNGVKLRLRW